MRFIVGYDKDLAEQCFKRNLRQLIRPESNSASRISLDEIEYFSKRLAETSVFNRVERLGNPWITHDEARELAKLPQYKATRRDLQKCEMTANNILVLEGIVCRAGATVSMDFEQGEILKKRIKISSTLYHKASSGMFYSARDRVVLREMSKHVFDWVRYLSYLPGNDLMDLLSTMEHSTFSQD